MDDTPIKLSKEQVSYILSQGDKMDLMDITRNVFGKPDLDGRSKEGRYVRNLLKNKGVEYKTTFYEKVDEIHLTEEHKEFVANHCKTLNSFEIAKILFKDRAKTPLSKPCVLISNYIKEINPAVSKSDNELVSEEYKAPSTFLKTLRKINDVTGINLEEEKINVKQKKCIENCQLFMNNHRYIAYINSLNFQNERDLFEAEFVGMVWDKPDLTRDEVNLCVNLCKEYINQQKIEKTISVLEELSSRVLEGEEGAKISMSSVEMIANYREDLKKSTELQRKLYGDLNTTRSERNKNKLEGRRSIAQLVEFVQEEENRRLIEKNTTLRKKLISRTVDEFTDHDGIIARVYGVNAEDILEWEPE